MVRGSRPIRDESKRDLTNERARVCPHLATVGYQNVNIATHTHLVLMIPSGGLRAHSELLRMAQNILGPSQVIVGVRRGVSLCSGV